MSPALSKCVHRPRVVDDCNPRSNGGDNFELRARHQEKMFDTWDLMLLPLCFDKFLAGHEGRLWLTSSTFRNAVDPVGRVSRASGMECQSFVDHLPALLAT